MAGRERESKTGDSSDVNSCPQENSCETCACFVHSRVFTTIVCYIYCNDNWWAQFFSLYKTYIQSWFTINMNNNLIYTAGSTFRFHFLSPKLGKLSGRKMCIFRAHYFSCCILAYKESYFFIIIFFQLSHLAITCLK